eukprot:GHVT01016737.1.p2 GENE.GHVT01016737.1~~GHVT01016737.1.p2  ORF type:complete len:435 (+),score=32.13 GHVT01016737.1:5244-6548(+)
MGGDAVLPGCQDETANELDRPSSKAAIRKLVANSSSAVPLALPAAPSASPSTTSSACHPVAEAKLETFSSESHAMCETPLVSCTNTNFSRVAENAVEASRSNETREDTTMNSSRDCAEVNELLYGLIRCDDCGQVQPRKVVQPSSMLECEDCGAAVHKKCYLGPAGNTASPEGWVCLYCESSRRHAETLKEFENTANDIRKATDCNPDQKKRKLRALVRKFEPRVPLPRHCPLCPRRRGVLIRTREGLLVHLCCVRRCPECSVTDAPQRVATGVAAVDIRRPAGAPPCCLCCWPEGKLVSCAAPNCTLCIHPICARLAGLEGVSAGTDNNGTSIPPVFCYLHGKEVNNSGVSKNLKVDDQKVKLGSEDADDLQRRDLLLCASAVLRRNHVILADARECIADRSPWSMRMSAYLLKELDVNFQRLRKLGTVPDTD